MGRASRLTRLHQFTSAHPAIELRFSAHRALVDVLRRGRRPAAARRRDDETDLSIRFGEGSYPGRIVEHLLGLALTPMLSYNNAVHINEEFAATTPFKGRIAHGMLTASVISAAIANKLPGPGTIYLGQNLAFKAPVRAGDTVHAKVTVRELSREKRLVFLDTVCTVRNTVVITGEAVVKVGSRTPRPDR